MIKKGKSSIILQLWNYRNKWAAKDGASIWGELLIQRVIIPTMSKCDDRIKYSYYYFFYKIDATGYRNACGNTKNYPN